MKKLWLMPALFMALISCNDNPEKYVVDGTVTGKGIGKLAILERRDERVGYQPIDTSEIKNGKFTFEGKAGEIGLFFIRIDSVGRSSLILEPGEIDITIKKDSLFANKLSGTPNNEQLATFSKESMKYQKELIDYQSANRERFEKAAAARDTAVFLQLKNELFAIRSKVDSLTVKYSEEYVSKNPDSYISALIVEDYINRYYNKPEIIERAFAGLSPEMKKTKTGQNIVKALEKMKTVDIGRRAPNFSAKNPEGKEVSLNESLGRVTIIDFWASWCGPCRRENPNVVALYNEYHSKGLNIIGVSLDKSADKWKEAIAKDGLAWTQISNLMEWNDPIAKKYGVESIPATFVLNQYGVVVAKNLSGEKLREKVAEMLK